MRKQLYVSALENKRKDTSDSKCRHSKNEYLAEVLTWKVTSRHNNWWTSRNSKTICFRWLYSNASEYVSKFFPARFILLSALYLEENIILFRVKKCNFSWSYVTNFLPGWNLFSFVAPFTDLVSLKYTTLAPSSVFSPNWNSIPIMGLFFFPRIFQRGLKFFLHDWIFKHGLNFSQGWNFLHVFVHFI